MENILRKLNEELHIDGAEYLGTDYGYDVYNITTWEAAQQFVGSETGSPAGNDWTNSEETFDRYIGRGELRLIFMVITGTNRVRIGLINQPSTFLVYAGRGKPDQEVQINYQMEFSGGAWTGAASERIFPLYLLPDFEISPDNGISVDRSFIYGDNGRSIIGFYKGFNRINNADNAEYIIPETCRSIVNIGPCDVENVRIPGTVQTIRQNALSTATSSFTTELDGIPASWDVPAGLITTGFGISPEEVEARAEQRRQAELARAEAEREEREAANRRIAAKLSTMIDQVIPNDIESITLEMKDDIEELNRQFKAQSPEVLELMDDEHLTKISNGAEKLATLVAAKEAAERAAREAAERAKSATMLQRLKYKVITDKSDLVSTKGEVGPDNNKHVQNEYAKKVVIIGCIPGVTELEIPSHIDNKEVIAIAPYAFYQDEDLQNVKIPDTVKEVGKYAFFGCSNCIIEIPGVRWNAKAKIGSNAFNNTRGTRNY